MIKAKEVKRCAHEARERIENLERGEKEATRRQAEADVAPVVKQMLEEIEKNIKGAMEKGAYGIEHLVKSLGDEKSEKTKAYRCGLLAPLRLAGFNVGFLENKERDGLSYIVSVSWSGG